MPTDDRTGFSHDQLLLLSVCRRCGVIDALTTSAGTAEAVAAETGIETAAADTLIGSLERMGFVKDVAGEYEITNRALGFLAKRDPRSIGPLSHELDLLDLYVELPDRLVSGDEPTFPPYWTENRVGAHAATPETTVRATVTAALREYPTAESVLVLHGESGTYATEFAARGVAVTMTATEDILEFVKPQLSHSDITLCTDDLSGIQSYSVDIVVGIGLSAQCTVDQLTTELSACRRVLADDGLVVLVETLADRSPNPTHQTLRTLATTGGVYTEAAFRSCFADAGFVYETTNPVPGTDQFSLVGRERAVNTAR
ncbi:SAM-dependent methyltransferase [Natronocalculus amylovorans]|uniref:SAM-dependent methyltransferase n=1 Tax=Natronocalculus amylovorans TaxID=2917812 RepID=A0AAE3FUZ8_9EURY|nr:SAM-dependent methyltransferase [Natronocalculus amylovorans]MCL9815701.1 SAM-dependent methyltransferase [Natronocalculus amylovorans]